MVQILIVAHAEIANSFAYCIEHILSKHVENLHILAIKKTEKLDNILKRTNDFITNIQEHTSEILILTDIYGATPSNIAKQLLKTGSIEVITGLNLSMLIRAISYASYGLKICASKAFDGAKDGIIHLEKENIC